MQDPRGDTELAVSPEEAATLRSRARALAGAATSRERDGAALTVLEFTLAMRRYAIESRYVREVHPLMQVTRIPCTPRFVMGLVNLRGQVLSVVDLRRYFDLEQVGLVDRNRVVVLRDGAMEFGLLADSIEGVARVPLSTLGPPPATLKAEQAAHIRGVTAAGGVVLDGHRLLHGGALIVREEVGP